MGSSSWRLAKSLEVLRAQVNAAFPTRKKSSDGTIGDAAHASRDSDHNPWFKDSFGVGVVSAIDFTHDPGSGFDAHAFAEALIKSKDRRIKYVISNRRIASGANGPLPWKWRPYNGANPHTQHMHLSVLRERCDETQKWEVVMPPPRDVGPAKPLVKSKIATGAGAAATLEVVDLARQLKEVSEITRAGRDIVESFGATDILVRLVHSPRFWITLAVIGVCVGVIYWRWRDHGRGSLQ